MVVKTFVVGVVRTNCYLVYDEKEKIAAIIDPARGHDKIKAFCDENGIKVAAVLITHGHFDHILDGSLWQNDGAKVYIHKLDEEKLHSEKNLAYMVGANVTQFNADVLVNDGDKICVGCMEFLVMHTPGHSIGACCYIVKDMIFSGDTLFCDDYGRVDFPDGSFEDIKASLKRLFSLSGDYKVFPGHEEQTTLQKERQSNAILRYL